ncbi:hypothetical protein V8E54_000264 [Elaphomyces granulatus]
MGMRPEGDVLKMYNLPSNWTAQRSAEQESEMGYLARIRKGEARDAMDGTITTVEKTQGPRHHSDSLEASRQAGGEKAPCVHNEPVIGIRLPASVREDNHDIPPCTSLAERGDFDASIHTLGPVVSNLELDPRRCWPPSPNPFKCPGSPGEERGDRPMDRDPFCEFGDKGWGNVITVNIAVTPPTLALLVYSSQRTVHADLEKNYCFIGLIL